MIRALALFAVAACPLVPAKFRAYALILGIDAVAARSRA